MKKQYIFLIMIVILLYISFLIIKFTYKEYKINSHIEYIISLNKDIKEKITKANDIIEYKSSKAYRNMILKQQQSFKNKGELVIYLTTEKKYEKYTKPINTNINIEKYQKVIENRSYMSIYQKWKNIIIGK